MIEYEQEDLDTAKEIITKGFLMDINRETLKLTEENIIECAKAYYQLRINSWDYNHPRELE